LTARRWPLVVLCGVGLVVLGRASLWDVCTLSSWSMSPSLSAGEVLLVRRVGPVRPGDIVVLRLGDADRTVKRVIAGPGSVVEGVGGRLVVDGVPLGEDQAEFAPVLRACRLDSARLTWETPVRSHSSTAGQGRRRRWRVVVGGADMAPQTVGPGQFFVAGDDRARSRDSRQWGPVLASEIDGVAVSVLPGRTPCDAKLTMGRLLFL